MSTLDRIIEGYLECAAWTDSPEGLRARFSNEAKRKAREDCAAFVTACGPLVTQAVDLPGYSPERFGHDFWLTRCGHGAGFWDRNELTVHACANVAFTDRDGRQYRACSVSEECTLGDALSMIAYGNNKHISRFAYASLDAYGGWLRFN